MRQVAILVPTETSKHRHYGSSEYHTIFESGKEYKCVEYYPSAGADNVNRYGTYVLKMADGTDYSISYHNGSNFQVVRFEDFQYLENEDDFSYLSRFEKCGVYSK